MIYPEFKVSPSEIRVYLVIILAFSLLCGSGLYGFGVDYHFAYSGANFSWSPTFFLGWRIATLSIRGVHLGVQLTSLITGVGLLMLYLSLSRVLFLRSRLWVIFTFILFLHTWPVILGNLNVMRQGIMMGTLWICLFLMEKMKYKLLFVTALLAFFCHKSSPYFLVILAMILCISRIHMKHYLKRSTFFAEVLVFGGIGVILLYVTIWTMLQDAEITQTTIIGHDMRVPLLCFNTFIIVFWMFFSPLPVRFSSLGLFSFLVCLTSPALVMAGRNFEYERINMVALIPMILFVVSSFPQSQRLTALIGSSSALLVVTHLAGSYTVSLY